MLKLSVLFCASRSAFLPHICQARASSSCTPPMDLRHVRKPTLYVQPGLLESELPAREPMGMFDHWFKTMCDTTNHTFEEKNGMTLATATITGRPSARRLLLKGYDSTGFTFFTNYGSRKGKELEANGLAVMEFYWPRFHNRSVRIEGQVSRVPAEESDEYWKMRPAQSRISAFISAQSSVIPSRDYLLKLAEETKAKYGEEIPRPPNWGGYRLVADQVEFWQGREDRLHDRIRFRRLHPGELLATTANQGDDGWIFERLSP